MTPAKRGTGVTRKKKDWRVNSMSIFSNKAENTKRSDKKVIGVYVPLSLNDFIVLSALNNQKTKSTHVNELLGLCVAEYEKKGVTLEHLISDTLKVALCQYMEEKSVNVKTNKQDFIEVLRNELLQKGLSDDCTELIIRKFNDETI